MKFFIIILSVLLLYTHVFSEKETKTLKKTSILAQWKQSPHANSMNTPDERIKMNTEACAHCHTTQGFIEVILEGKESTAPYKNVKGLGCNSCHYSKKERVNKATSLRAGSVGDACNGCHDLIFLNNTEEFSTCPQGSLVKGTGGSEFKNKEYKSHAHGKLKKNCVSCHMAQSEKSKISLRVGGHIFRVVSKGKKPRILNSNACIDCHKVMTYEIMQQSQKKTKKLMEELASLLPSRDKTEYKKAEERPRLPKDPSLNINQAKASYNYWTILKDGTYGIHNPVYIRQLLTHSIEVLKKSKSSYLKTL